MLQVISQVLEITITPKLHRRHILAGDGGGTENFSHLACRIAFTVLNLWPTHTKSTLYYAFHVLSYQ